MFNFGAFSTQKKKKKGLILGFKKNYIRNYFFKGKLVYLCKTEKEKKKKIKKKSHVYERFPIVWNYLRNIHTNVMTHSLQKTENLAYRLIQKHFSIDFLFFLFYLNILSLIFKFLVICF